jgi:hypothetical protein
MGNCDSSNKDVVDGACYNKCPEGMWHLYHEPWYCVNADHFCSPKEGNLVMKPTKNENKNNWIYKKYDERWGACPAGTELITVSKRVKQGVWPFATYHTLTKNACSAKYKNETCCTPGTGCEGTSLCTTSTTESINSFYNKQIDYS